MDLYRKQRRLKKKGISVDARVGTFAKPYVVQWARPGTRKPKEV